MRTGERRLEEAAQTATANRNRIRTLLATTRSLREDLDTVLARLAERPPVQPAPADPPASPAAPAAGPAADTPEAPATSDTPPRTEPPSSPEPTPPATGEAEPAEAGRPDSYTVQRGDTLSDIARRFEVSLPALLEANPGLDPNLIQVGQQLNLPPPGDS